MLDHGPRDRTAPAHARGLVGSSLLARAPLPAIRRPRVPKPSSDSAPPPSCRSARSTTWRPPNMKRSSASSPPIRSPTALASSAASACFSSTDYADAATELAPLAARQTGVERRRVGADSSPTSASPNTTSATPPRPTERDELLDAAIDALGKHLDNFPTARSRRRRPIYHAEALYARGRLDEAVAAYRSLLAKYPAAPAARRRALRPGRRRAGATRLSPQPSKRSSVSKKSFRSTPPYADARARHGDALLVTRRVAVRCRASSPPPAERSRACSPNFPESALVPPALALMAQVQLERVRIGRGRSARSTSASPARPTPTSRATPACSAPRSATSAAISPAASPTPTTRPRHDPRRTEALAPPRPLRSRARPTRRRRSNRSRKFSLPIPTTRDTDHVLYDLAWAYQAANEPDAATATFARLAAVVSARVRSPPSATFASAKPNMRPRILPPPPRVTSKPATRRPIPNRARPSLAQARLVLLRARPVWGGRGSLRSANRRAARTNRSRRRQGRPSRAARSARRRRDADDRRVPLSAAAVRVGTRGVRRSLRADVRPANRSAR